ncbi:hypothetical protein [Actinoplanes sp. NPDC049316]|uniref:hypothetical protein n=1 Tax=Actinoplanes sp. NPDC049316 TaxID=3154727 RepID=UPI00342E9153
MYPGAPAPRSRPTVVTVSSYLLYLSAALIVLDAVLTVTTISKLSEVYTDLYADTSNSGLESVMVGVSVISVVINFLLAAGLAILAVFNNRGRQGSRITTWVIGGISFCCFGSALAGNALTSAMNLDTGSTSGPSARELEERLSEALPSWYPPVTMTLSVVLALAILTALILLMLPAANAYFRKPQPTWDPSMPYPAYPGQPGYPQAGQPQQPSYPAPGSFPPYPGTTPPAAPPAAGAPHTGSVPATDPWSAPTPPTPPASPPSSSDTPPASPPSSSDTPPASSSSSSDAPPSPGPDASSSPEQPGRPPTDPA